MSFRSQLTTDLDVFFNTDEFGIEITYTPNGGSATTITVVPAGKSESIQSPPPAEDEADYKVKASDISSLSAYDTFTISGTTYYFKERLGGEHSLIQTLRLTRSERRQL